MISTEDMLADPTIGALLVSSDMRQDELLDRLYPLAGDRYSLLTIYQPEELSRRRAEGRAIDEAQLALAH